MANNNDEKLISGLTARKYLNCNKAEFENLVEQGIIQAYRDEEMRWRVSKESVLSYTKRSQLSGETRLIVNDNHYEEVVERMCAAKTSIRIMTGDFNLFKLKPTTNHEGIPFINYLIEKAEQGIAVQIILSNPTTNVDAELKEYFRNMKSYPLSTRNCIRNHAKVVIVDDKIAYIGSANATRAGLGQFKPGNFEVGVLTEDSGLVTTLKAYFSKIWDGDFCEGCHRYKNCIEY